MQVKVTLVHTGWHKVERNHQTIWFKGWIEADGEVIDHRNLNDWVDHPWFQPESLKEWRGNFALICQQAGQTWIAVDRKRSIPLFYYYEESGNWVVTDHIDRKVSREDLLPVSVYELLLTGYVCNEKTLISGVQQVEAGEYVIFTGFKMVEKHKEKQRGKCVRSRYFSYFHQPEDWEENDWVDQLKPIFLEVFHHLHKRLKDQTVMLPLSGGLDSRIVALLLKECGIQKIQAFSYGIPGNAEAKKSKEIADRLGIPWKFIPYSHQDWYRWFHSEQWKKFVRFTTRFVTIPHIQDWPAVQELTRQQEGAFVFVPGHTGDFLGGGHIPVELTEDRSYQLEDVIKQIKLKHFRLWDTKNREVWNGVTHELKKGLAHLPCQHAEEASALFEYWDWKERQAKFIIHSVRTYEFFGHRWEIPLWDERLVDFFLKVPLKYRYRKYLYDLTLYEMYPNYFSKPVKVEDRQIPAWKKGKVYQVLRKGYAIKLLLEQYKKNPMGWFGIVGSYWDYLKKTRYRYEKSSFNYPYNINSLVAVEYLNSLFSE